jgi:hypothetical protein
MTHEAIADIPEEQPGTEESFDARERLNLLHAAIQQLPTRARPEPDQGAELRQSGRAPGSFGELRTDASR